MSNDYFIISNGDQDVALHKPESIQWGNSRDIVMFDQWAGQHIIYDGGKQGETFTVNGIYRGISSTNIQTFEQSDSGTGYFNVWGNNIAAQRFTIGYTGENVHQSIVSVMIRGVRVGASTATCHLHLRKELLGDNLSTGTFRLSLFAALSSNYITMQSSCTLAPDIDYYFVVEHPTGTSEAGDNFRLYWDTTAPYTQGESWRSIDGGLLWEIYPAGSTRDFRFIINGYKKHSPYDVMRLLDEITEAGEEIMISNMHDDLFDTTWLIKNYSYSGLAGMPNSVEWNITFERA